LRWYQGDHRDTQIKTIVLVEDLQSFHYAFTHTALTMEGGRYAKLCNNSGNIIMSIGDPGQAKPPYTNVLLYDIA
jgi:hypothetical protein